MDESDRGGGFLTGLLIGGIVGAVVGLLLAPRSGKETLEQVREQSAEWREKGQTLVDEELASLKETVAEMQEILKEALEEGREVFREAVEEGKDASVRATGELQSRFQAARERRQS